MSSRHRAEVDAALKLIAEGGRAADFESPTLDFKEERSSASETERMIADAAICFANSGGGTVVLGVRDKAHGADALVGTSIAPERLQQRVHELSRPPLLVEVSKHALHPNILLIAVAPGVEIHADTQGRALRRLNRDCLPMTPTEQAALREERHGRDFSAEPSGRKTSEAIPEAVALARRMLGVFSDERRLLAGATDEDLFVALGATSSRGEFNKAGELMFCAPTDPQRVHLLYQHRSTPSGEPKIVQRLSGPLLQTFVRTMEFVQARTSSVPITLPDGQQFSIEDFPGIAVRESLSNALCHRDWRVSEPVNVDHAATLMRVVSPGALVAGVTPNNIITTVSKPRNPALARMARHLGLAEELGSGVDRMIRAMIRSGRRLPVIEDEARHVTVTLFGGAANTQIARFIALLPEAERNDTDTMLLLLYLCEHRTVTALMAAPWLQKSEQEAEEVLRRLSAEELPLLEATRATAARSNRTYRLRSEALRGLGSAVAYSRRTVDDIDRKVIAHLREYGKLTNNTLRNLFDIDVYRARDIIADLAARGIVVRTSDAQRGPSVEWGPGPKLPTARSRSGRRRA